MIIETRDDVVRLSGSLSKNQWPAIRAAAIRLLKDHPHGVIVDCDSLDEISGEGAGTFVDAIRDLEASKARILLANLPNSIVTTCKGAQAGLSALPIAGCIEEARASLRASDSSQALQGTRPERKTSVILVPLVHGMDLTFGAHLAGRLARGSQAEVRLTYFLEVARTMPLASPQIEAERDAQTALSQALELTKQFHVPVVEHVERVRDLREGILGAIKAYQCDIVVIGTTTESIIGDQDNFRELVQALLQRGPCEVVVGRLRTGA